MHAPHQLAAGVPAILGLVSGFALCQRLPKRIRMGATIVTGFVLTEGFAVVAAIAGLHH